MGKALGLALLLVSLLLAAVEARPALAHAGIVQSDPPAGAVLAQSPNALVLTYTEDLDPSFASVRLLDASGAVVVAGPGTVSPDQPAELRLDLPPLPDGTYTARWQVRSVTDGHVTQGFLGFSVGASSLPASLLPPQGMPDPATALPAPADALLRWASYVATAVATGSVFFGLLVWRPAYVRWEERNEAADRQASRLLGRVSRFGIGALALLTLVIAGLSVIQSMLAMPGQIRSVVAFVTGRTGVLFAIRLVLLGALAAVTTRLTAAGSGPVGPWGLAAALGAAVLLTFSLGSHSAALGSTKALLHTSLDWIHILAMSAWFGGLLPLELLLWRRGVRLSLVQVLIPRFSIMALVSTSVLAVTGVINAFPLVGSLQALIATTYGRTLIAKVGLFGVLLLMGAINLLILSPRLRQGVSLAVGWLRRTVSTELSLALILLMAVGVLTNVAPARLALQAHQQLGVVETVRDKQVRMVLRVAPLQLGDNEFGVDLQDRRPGADAVPATVLLRLTMAEHAMETIQVEMTAQDNGRYTARGSYLSAPGPWQMEVIVRRAGFDDVRHSIDLVVPTEAAAQ